MSSARRLLFAGVCLLWTGFAIGVAFAEAVKFRVPTLSRGVAFDVGRTVFEGSQWVQVCLGLLALGFALAGRVSRWAWGCLALVAVALVLQMVWVFPALNARVQTVLAGGIRVAAPHHALYTGLESLKLLALLAAAVASVRTPKPISSP